MIDTKELDEALEHDFTDIVCSDTDDAVIATLWKSAKLLSDIYPDLMEMAHGIDAVHALIADSDGVYGLHLNGDASPWSELQTGGRFDEWLDDFDTAVNATLRVVGKLEKKDGWDK